MLAQHEAEALARVDAIFDEVFRPLEELEKMTCWSRTRRPEELEKALADLLEQNPHPAGSSASPEARRPPHPAIT